MKAESDTLHPQTCRLIMNLRTLKTERRQPPAFLSSKQMATQNIRLSTVVFDDEGVYSKDVVDLDWYACSVVQNGKIFDTKSKSDLGNAPATDDDDASGDITSAWVPGVGWDQDEILEIRR